MEKRPPDSNLASAKKKQKTSQTKSGSGQRKIVTFSTLPLEILTKIIENLDTESLMNLHETELIPLKGLVTECSFSQSTLAIAKSLKTKFFLHIASHLKVLNLSGVPNLTWPNLEIALKKTKNLTDLDVMCTKIIMPDFVNIVKIRKKLKSIAISFAFGHRRDVIGQKIITQLQRAFQGIKNVKFVTAKYESFRLSKVALKVLQKAKLNNLTFIIDYNYAFDKYSFDDDVHGYMISLKQFQLYFLKGDDESALNLGILSLIDIKDYEIIILRAFKNMTNVYATTLLKNAVRENISGDVETLTDSVGSMTEFKALLNSFFEDNGLGFVVMFWDKKQTDFDDKFNSKLMKYLKEQVIFCVNLPSIAQVPTEFKWYSVDQSTSNSKEQAESIEIDYGKIFKEKDDIKLNIRLDKSFYNYIIKPSADSCDFAKKISHLYLYGSSPHYDLIFFNNLFEQCTSLVTFQITNVKDPIIFQSLGKSRSLKNIYLESIEIKYETLFDYLSGCPSLENIVLVDIEDDNVREMSYLFNECENLYNFCIQIDDYDDDALNRIAKMCRTCKNIVRGKTLNIDIIGECGYRYNPYLNVFNVCQLRPVPWLDKLIR